MEKPPCVCVEIMQQRLDRDKALSYPLNPWSSALRKTQAGAEEEGHGSGTVLLDFAASPTRTNFAS